MQQFVLELDMPIAQHGHHLDAKISSLPSSTMVHSNEELRAGPHLWHAFTLGRLSSPFISLYVCLLLYVSLFLYFSIL